MFKRDELCFNTDSRLWMQVLRPLSFSNMRLHFTEKPMDNKEVNDPLTSVTLIKGKSHLTIF